VDIFCADCSETEAAAIRAHAASEPLAPLTQPVKVTDANFGRVPRVYIETTQDRAVGNAVRMGRLSLLEALAMATVNPARVCRVAGRQRGLTPGEKADLVRFRWDEAANELTVVETIVAGSTVYSAE